MNVRALTRPLSVLVSVPQVYVEFDDLEWEKREWVKVYEDFQIFLLEHQLVWAKRKESSQVQGTKAKQIQWPALVSDLAALLFCLESVSVVLTARVETRTHVAKGCQAL